MYAPATEVVRVRVWMWMCGWVGVCVWGGGGGGHVRSSDRRGVVVLLILIVVRTSVHRRLLLLWHWGVPITCTYTRLEKYNENSTHTQKRAQLNEQHVVVCVACRRIPITRDARAQV
jgi:hypothetical protein